MTGGELSVVLVALINMVGSVLLAWLRYKYRGWQESPNGAPPIPPLPTPPSSPIP